MENGLNRGIYREISSAIDGGDATRNEFELLLGQNLGSGVFGRVFEHRHLLFRELHDRRPVKLSLSGIIAVRMVCRTEAAKEAVTDVTRFAGA
jgi:hypothetical protein